MTDMNLNPDLPPNSKTPIPSGLNVLTILTFIGCGLAAIFSLCMPWFFKFSMRMIDNAINNGNLPESKITEMELQRPKLEMMIANAMPLMLIGLVGVGLCFYGALRMRKLKKEGFYIYVLGQLLPFIGSGLLIGFAAQFNGAMSYVFAAIPVIFIILYARQLKHMS